MQHLSIPKLLRRYWAVRLVPYLQIKPGFIERHLQRSLNPPTVVRVQPTDLFTYASKSPERLLERFITLTNTFTQKYRPMLLEELLGALNGAIDEYNALINQPAPNSAVYYSCLPNKRIRAIYAPRLIAMQIAGVTESAFRLEYSKWDDYTILGDNTIEHRVWRLAKQHPWRLIECYQTEYRVLTQPMEHIKL